MENNIMKEFSAVMFRIRAISLEMHSDNEINMSELMMLSLIDKHPSDSPISCFNKMKKSLFVTKSAVSQLLKNLEKKCFIVRRANECDRRKTEITLTEKGKFFLAEQGKIARDMAKLVFERYGEKEMIQLISDINRFIDINIEIKNIYRLSENKMGENANGSNKS